MDPDIVAQRIIEYGDGWIPLDGGHELEPTIDAIRKEADRAGRTLDEFELTVGLGLMGPITEARYREVVEMGFSRVLFVLPRRGRQADLETLESFAELKRSFERG